MHLEKPDPFVDRIIKASFPAYSGRKVQIKNAQNVGKHGRRTQGLNLTFERVSTMKYSARFYGRTTGAIGAMYWITTICEGETKEQARVDLYTRYEHIMHLTLTPIE